MKAYSMDLRQRVIDDCDAGLATKAVSQKYSVSPAWVRRLKQHRRERGDIVPRTGGGFRSRKIDPERLRGLVEAQPEATLEELRERLGVGCSAWAVGKALRKLGMTLKKRRSTPPSRTGRTSPSDSGGGSSRPRTAMPAG